MNITLDKWAAIAIVFVAWAIASMFTFKFQINIGEGCNSNMTIERKQQ